MNPRSTTNSKLTKKSIKKPARKPAASTAKPPAATKKSGLYVGVVSGDIVIADQKPIAGGATGPFANFKSAKSAALDLLLEFIENAEASLIAIKRARELADLHPAKGARAPRAVQAAKR